MDRNADGTFGKGGRGGPGRGRVGEHIDRYRAETRDETLQLLAGDVGRLEAELTDIDSQISEAESAFLESMAPMLKRKSLTESDLGRCRVAQYYLSDPTQFSGLGQSPSETLLAEYNEIRAELEQAGGEFAATAEPTFTRAEALIDQDRWQKLHHWEQLRDRVDELSA